MLKIIIVVAVAVLLFSGFVLYMDNEEKAKTICYYAGELYATSDICLVNEPNNYICKEGKENAINKIKEYGCLDG